jgi:hypothetical protein
MPDLPKHLIPVLEQLERKGTVSLERDEAGEVTRVDTLDVEQLRAEIARRRKEADDRRD